MVLIDNEVRGNRATVVRVHLAGRIIRKAPILPQWGP